jgi:TetR/AcrR family transcriptional repressor of mexCD-oprJ operon
MIGRDDELLRKLAAALFANPRGTTKDLAEAAGISRATFNRFCGSREHLMEMITQQAEDSLHEIIRIAKQPAKDYNDALNRLLEAHFQNQEYLVFSCSAQHSLDSPYWADYLSSLDTFFLNGQKAGTFRLEYPNQMLTELFVAMICGMIDAEYRGRIAPAGIEAKMSAFFMNGAAE